MKPEIKEKTKKARMKFSEFFKTYYKYIFLGIGLAGITIMILQSPKDVPWDLFTNPKILCILAGTFGTWILIYILHTLCYKIMLKDESKKIPFSKMFRICWTGFALNNVTPAGLVGGEPYRIMELKKYCSKEKSTGSTLCFTLFYTIGHLMLWLAGVIVYFALGVHNSAATWITVLLSICGTVALGVIVIFLTCRNHGFVYPFMKRLSQLRGLRKKLGPKFESKQEVYKDIDKVIIDFRHEGWRFFVVLALQFITRLLEAFEYYLIIKYFAGPGRPVNYFEGLLVMSTCSLIGNLLFVVPMQAGTREGGMVIALGFLKDLPSGIAFPTGILYRFREIVFTAIGIILVATTKRKEKSIESNAVNEISIEDNKQEENKEMSE